MALLSLFARIYRLSYEEENFGREIFDFEVVCGKFLQSLERSYHESRRKESLVIVGEISNFDLDENPLRILRADGGEKRNCLNYRVELSECFL